MRTKPYLPNRNSLNYYALMTVVFVVGMALPTHSFIDWVWGVETAVWYGAFLYHVRQALIWREKHP